MKKCLFGLLLISAVIFAETVGEVRVSSTTKAMNPEALESLVANCVSTKVGDTLSAKSLSEDIRKLVLSGKVDDVRTDISKNADGQTVLTYIITPKPIISAIVFTGNTQYKEKKLRNNLKVAVGEQVDESAIAESRKEMLKRYTDDGFYGTEIKTVRTLDEDGNVRLTFAIKEPTHCKLHKVYFENNTVFDTDELRTAIVTQRQWWRYIFRMGNYFNPDQLPLDKEKLRQLYGKKGYMDFTVKEIRQEKIEEDTWIDVTFVLDEGQPYTVGKMSVTGNTLFASSLLLSKTLTKTGDVHDTERELLDIDMIRAGYDELGYIDLKIYPYYLKNSEKHVVDVEFRIMEGKPASVRNIDITGNTITKDEVIRRELAIAPGDLGDTRKIKTSKRRLENLGYFSSVEILPVDTENPELKDLNIQLKEKPTGSLSVGAGYSSEDSAVGFIEFSESNFSIKRLITGQWPPKGDGERLRTRIQIGSKTSSVIISHTEPWFLDRRLELTTDAFLTNRYEDEYDERHLGIGQMISWPVAFQLPFLDHVEAWRLGVGYKLEQVRISAVTERKPSEARYSKGYVPDRVLADDKGSSIVPRLIFRATRDTRNAFLFPSSGSRFYAQTELINKAWGGYESYARFTLDGSKYFALTKSLTLKLGAAYHTNSNDKAGIFDRYFAGGLGTVRGFDRRDVAPFDKNDDAIGGNSMLTGTAELLIPVKKIFYFCVFTDAGNAWWDNYKMELDDLCYSTGVGIQLQMLPVSIYYGYPLHTNKNFIGSKSGRLHFNMGFNF